MCTQRSTWMMFLSLLKWKEKQIRGVWRKWLCCWGTSVVLFVYALVKVGLIIISCSSYFCSSWSMVLLQCQVVCRKCFPYLLLFLSFVSPDNEPWSLIPLYLCFLCSYSVLFLSLWTLEGIIHVQNKLNFLKYISWLWKVASNKLVRSYADFTC